MLPDCTCDRDTIAENMASPDCPAHAPGECPASGGGSASGADGTLNGEATATRDAPSDHSGSPVGEGSEYDEVRAAVRKLLPLFGHVENGSVGSWGCGMIDILEPAEEGHQAVIVWPVASRWEQRSNALTRTFDVGMIRATGLALLAYAEAADARLASDETEVPE